MRGGVRARARAYTRLTVPTGGGKTLSSLRFALGHAARGMERIFYVIPFNTILDQNARDIREALDGYDGILEHHGNVVVEDEGERMHYRRLTERWDSRIILTSMVQFLNALYRRENTNARRMHRLTRSVIVFDEIQALPRRCKVLFERAVNFLVLNCGCTVLLCTATQMEFDNIVMPNGNELMGDEKELSRLYDALTRVRWNPELRAGLTNADAARKLQNLMRSHGSVLAIVNTKAVAWDVYRRAAGLLGEQGMRPVAHRLLAGERGRHQSGEGRRRGGRALHLSDHAAVSQASPYVHRLHESLARRWRACALRVHGVDRGGHQHQLSRLSRAVWRASRTSCRRAAVATATGSGSAGTCISGS